MKILITGANGQLGTELRYLLDEKGIEYKGTGSKELDITDKKAVDNYIFNYKPDVIYHCAAYTAVDAAEEEPGKTADYNVNVIGTKNVAEAAERVDATLIYISTDYVFDGTKNGMYTEEDTPNPKNEYGRTKLLGEKAVSETMSKYYIIRTSWVFGKYGKNFVYTMLNLAKTHDHLTVVDDQVGRPTWTRTLAEFMLYVVENKADYGLYQLSNEGHCSWYEFAKEILKDDTNIIISPISSDQYLQKAYRPKRTILSLNKVESLGFDLINWRNAVDRAINEMN